MSIITAPLPEAVEYGGESYGVKTDFRAWIGFYESMERGDVAGMLGVYRRLPPTLRLALELAVGFGNGGALPYGAQSSGRRVLDWETDAQLIYAAFMGEYGIDLCETELHWYKFCALLAGLSDERYISRIMAIRAADLSSVPEGRRRKLKRLKRIYACADRRSVSQRDADAAAELWKAYGN